MAENESLDLGSSGAIRWNAAFTAFQNDDHCLRGWVEAILDNPREAVTALLSRYRDEWMAVASDGNRKGLPWARLLAAPRPQRQGVTHASA